jgi:gliding motility-associated-like protein
MRATTPGVRQKIFMLIAAWFVCTCNVSAQKENNVWVFGNGLGLDFNAGSPSLITTAIPAEEGCASICDASGKLMFYTNCVDVWDRTHNIMPNGTGIAGPLNVSSTMGVAIAPVISNTNLFFLFSVDASIDRPKLAQLKYSLIDMRLNAGRGDVVAGVKGISLDSPVSEKIIVVPACGGVWVITHHADSPVFNAYKINGLTIPAPVRSTVSGIIKQNVYCHGEIKLSPDGQQIAMVNKIYPSTKIELFHFDNKTGIVNSLYAFDSIREVYGVEFSPDASKLYVSQWAGSVFQYDLSLLPNTSAVTASRFSLGQIEASSLRRGPDKKIYFLSFDKPNQIKRINDPDKAGAACTPEINAPSLASTLALYYSFGNTTAKPIPIEESKIVTGRKDIVICAGELYTAPARRDLYLWNDGDTSRSRILSQGTYWLTSYKDCDVYRDTIVITEKPITFVATSLDTVLCFEKSITMTAHSAQDQYIWSDGHTGPDNIFTQSGIKWVNARDSKNCILYSDTFKVTLTDFEVEIPDTALCDREIIVLHADVSKPASYLWQDGSTNNSFTVNVPGRYEVTVFIGDCRKKKEINVTHLSFDAGLPADTTICADALITLKANIDNATYRWQDNSTAQTIAVRQPGTYTVQVTQGACYAEDSVLVKTRQCNNCIHIPNAFSPNGDGKNDDFSVLLHCQVRQYALQIVNRYGEVIFQSKTPGERWNGRFKNREQELGVYYYLLQVTFDLPGATEELYKGDVSLIR